ncbi:DinB family protein [Paenibacillus psychroresistens]|uniref:DinB family protein n=1 Tax=Paenibacillus psychroresistens TaxID=1778678 RepID=A0A6B8RNB7_9BACL|nr:DinB family protein [Paenibacillus psychroresistens]QGQ97810.1 DinB family protein [Paenibacillus psychroresistens]
MSIRPETDEYPALAEQYVRLVPEGSLKIILQNQHDITRLLLGGLTEEQAAFKYAEGKWSLKTVVGHIVDVERLWNYRILRIARGDVRELPGYDRDIFALEAPFEDLPFIEVLKDYSAVRQSSITLINHLSESIMLRRGEFQNHPLSARAAAFIIAGHETHHMNVIKARYLLP